MRVDCCADPPRGDPARALPRAAEQRLWLLHLGHVARGASRAVGHDAGQANTGAASNVGLPLRPYRGLRRRFRTSPKTPGHCCLGAGVVADQHPRRRGPGRDARRPPTRPASAAVARSRGPPGRSIRNRLTPSWRRPEPDPTQAAMDRRRLLDVSAPFSGLPAARPRQTSSRTASGGAGEPAEPEPVEVLRGAARARPRSAGDGCEADLAVPGGLPLRAREILTSPPLRGAWPYARHREDDGSRGLCRRMICACSVVNSGPSRACEDSVSTLSEPAVARTAAVDVRGQRIANRRHSAERLQIALC